LNKTKLSILVVGASGQLGSEIFDRQALHSTYSFIFLKKGDLDISSYSELETYFEDSNIDVVINCAAYTKVAQAELERDKADAANFLGVKNLATLARERAIKLIHISTDSVFDGQNSRPYIESDATNPLNAYSKSKVDGENAMLAVNPENSIIIRTSWVYSKYGNNFVKTMVGLGCNKKSVVVINDQIGTPTSAKDLACAILNILPNIVCKNVEIYHYSNEGAISWFDFAKEIFAQSNIDCLVEPISTIDYGANVKRPLYSVLDTRKIRNDFNIDIPFWKDSLIDCLMALGVKIDDRPR
jgi:dTDP-4-dehydrorhamnose reductase